MTVPPASEADGLLSRTGAATRAAANAPVTAQRCRDPTPDQRKRPESTTLARVRIEGVAWPQRGAAIEGRLQLEVSLLLTPEDAGWVGLDLVEQPVDWTGIEVVIAVPAAVSVGPVQAPVVGAGAVAQLGHAYSVGRPELSGQRNWSYFMLHAAGSGTRRRLPAESCSRVPNGDESDYSEARCTGQCLPVLSLPSGTRYGGPARLSPRH
jgi:hypothetical protein